MGWIKNPLAQTKEWLIRYSLRPHDDSVAKARSNDSPALHRLA